MKIVQRPQEKIKLVIDGSISMLRTHLWTYICKQTANDLQNYYIENRQREMESDSRIIKDVSRTYPSEAFYQSVSSQMKMFHVAKVYCGYDEQIGYCQGMCFPIGAVLRLFDELNAFTIIYHMFVVMKMRYVFDVEKGTSSRVSIKFMDVLSKELPKVHKQFLAIGYDLDIFMIPWLLTFTGSFFNITAVTDVLDLIFLFGPTSTLNLLLAMMQVFSDDLVNLSSSAEVHSFFRYRFFDLYLNNKAVVLSVFSQLVAKDKFKSIFDELEKISLTPKQTTINDLINVPKLQGAALTSLVDSLTKLSLELIYENDRLKTEMSNGPKNNEIIDTKNGDNKDFKNSTIKKNPMLHNYESDCNVCKVKEHDLNMIIKNLKKYSETTFQVAEYFKQILGILRSSQVEGAVKNSMNPYKLYEDLIDSASVEIKSKLDIINLEQDLMSLQSDFLHQMKKINSED